MFIGEVLVAMAASHELGMRSTQRYASYTCKQVLQDISKPLYSTLPTVEKVTHITTRYSSIATTHSSTIHTSTPLSTPHKKRGTISTVDTWVVLQCNKPVAKCILH